MTGKGAETGEPDLMHGVGLAGPRALAHVRVPYPVVPPGDRVIVRLEMAGICGSDRPGFVNGHNDEGERPAGYPVHECLGTVVDGSVPALLGKRVLAIPEGDRGLCQYIVARPARTHVLRHPRLDDSVSVVAQPMATVLAALDRLGDIAGARVAVLGLGPIGLMLGLAARDRGAAHLAGYDRQDRRGAPLAEFFDEIGTAPDGAGEFDVVIEAAGHQQATVNQAVHAVAPRGKVLVLGVPDDEVYAFGFRAFFRKSLSLIASVQPDWQHYLPRAEEFVATRSADITSLVTHTFDVAETQNAFEAAFSGNDPGRGKVLISPGSWQ